MTDETKPPTVVNVTIHRIEVNGDDPDRFAFGLVDAFRDAVARPSKAARDLIAPHTCKTGEAGCECSNCPRHEEVPKKRRPRVGRLVDFAAAPDAEHEAAMVIATSDSFDDMHVDLVVWGKDGAQRIERAVDFALGDRCWFWP